MLAALRKHGGCLDASDTGTGKTITFLALCKAVNARPAIVTHKAIIPGWKNACKLMDIEPVLLTNYEQCKSKNFLLGRTTHRTDPSVGPVVNGYEWEIPDQRVIFCFDEAQALRQPTSINSRMALAARARWKTCLLSATPFQTPLEAGVIGPILGMFMKSQFYPWLFKHGCKKAFHGGWEFIGDKRNKEGKPYPDCVIKGQEIMAALHSEIFPSRGCRTRHCDIPGFPDTVIETQAVETGNADEITQKYLAELEERKADDHARACEGVDEEFHDLVEVLPMVRDLRFRQEAELLKCAAIAEMAKSATDKGISVVIFVNFDSSVEDLSQRLKCKWIIRGCGMGNNRKNLDRDYVIEAFQKNWINTVIVNSAAGGAGLSLHDIDTQRPRETLISPPFSAVRLKQILGRAHRLGGGFSRQRVLFAAGTIEEKAMHRVQSRLSNLDALTDGDLDFVADLGFDLSASHTQ